MQREAAQCVCRRHMGGTRRARPRVGLLRTRRLRAIPISDAKSVSRSVSKNSRPAMSRGGRRRRTMNLVDPASSHTLDSKTKPCMCQRKAGDRLMLRTAH